ncbi:hypothetical protein B0H16DRAFT_1454597 [Mycena metata]|uniref:Uncharacterized protein n=1 Tax=Mycena metata TaxID=1033252 RepID=A0AAD7NKZ1_9AGAR|nr:hypothetical protein B0H16DRAFT_1454597 [Mycena metata]
MPRFFTPNSPAGYCRMNKCTSGFGGGEPMTTCVRVIVSSRLFFDRNRRAHHSISIVIESTKWGGSQNMGVIGSKWKSQWRVEELAKGKSAAELGHPDLGGLLKRNASCIHENKALEDWAESSADSEFAKQTSCKCRPISKCAQR